MPQHLHMWLAAVAAAHEGQQCADTTAVNHQLAAGLAVARAELNGSHCCDNLQQQHRIHISQALGSLCTSSTRNLQKGAPWLMWGHDKAVVNQKQAALCCYLRALSAGQQHIKRLSCAHTNAPLRRSLCCCGNCGQAPARIPPCASTLLPDLVPAPQCLQGAMKPHN